MPSPAARAALRVVSRSHIARAITVLGLVLALILIVVLARTVVLAKTDPTTPLTYPAPAIDAFAAAANLSTALRFETISSDDASNPAALERLRAWIIETYPRFHSIARRTVVGSGTLVYEWAGTDSSLQPIVLMAHQDVVPVPQPERWTHPPFSGAIAEGSIWGRGALDNKSSLIAILEAAESLVAAGHQPERNVIFVFGHDEESGGAGAAAAAEWLASRKIKAAFVLDEGGVSINDSPVTGRPATLISIAEKGVVTLRLTVNVPGGHANAPGKQTAVDTLAQTLVAIRNNPFPQRYEGVAPAMLETLAPHAPFMSRMAITNSWLFGPALRAQISATPQGAAMLQTTIAPTMLQGSPKLNVLPSIATATVNLRILQGDSIQSVIAHVRESIGDLPVEVTTIGPSGQPSPVASTESDGYRLIAGVAAATFDAPVAPLLTIGFTDSRHMRVLSDDVYGFQPVQLGMADAAIVHGIDERISVENFRRMLGFYQQVLIGGGAGALRSRTP